MVPRTSFPATTIHADLTQPLAPDHARALLAAFLQHTETRPHLHPDAQLSASGITFAAQSGPRGGLALHHLRRIDAGLKGENLAVEDEAALEREFGGVSEGDDAAIGVEVVRGKKWRRRGADEESVRSWAEEAATSEAAYGTPQHAGMDGEADGDAEDAEGYRQRQEGLMGEVGEREGASGGSRTGGVPAVQKIDKRARKDAKKARNKAERQEKRLGQKGAGG